MALNHMLSCERGKYFSILRKERVGGKCQKNLTKLCYSESNNYRHIRRGMVYKNA